MLRRYSFLSILMITALLAGCVPKAVAQAAEVRALENPTSAELTEKATSIPAMEEEVVPRDPPPSCPVTTPQDPPFIPPSPYDSLGFEGNFWYGSNSLWTAVCQDGIWEGLPHNPSGYTQKVFWWRDGYVWTEEPEPDLIVTSERLDAPAPALIASTGTNAYASDIGSAMLVGLISQHSAVGKLQGNMQMPNSVSLYGLHHNDSCVTIERPDRASHGLFRGRLCHSMVPLSFFANLPK